jgi:maltose alpha-D-glucosyltransferase/alpha-amylase
MSVVRQKRESSWLEDDPLWYKDAIVYELHVRSFYDSDGDGVGDFAGLAEKLDYLQDLGVNAIWLLPFYPSPLKDDGYDTADYTNVHPAYGTLRDFRQFLQEANRRGLRVITELILNHTSDQHRWFRRARRAAGGSRWRGFYVWSDTADKYRDTRIIFKDFESSNWAWDPVARSYYWHRFYSHQPDLNFDSALVRQAILRVVDFWLGLGVSGLRLDAVPYLYEREGTNCENLPETHAFLKYLRRHVDEKFENRMLLGEANQWPEDAAAYFGEGDECHMAFHFPVMPRLFMAARMEDRFPIADIIQQTPPIPDNCQWGLFLRNHDELTLEMVTDEERDYMYRVFAHDPQTRINLGIRRRLAPLLNNDRKKMELMNSLLFSLPGTPIIYYGDEIGMGDNFYLGDRNGVRTPMQWSPDRNAGFSYANPQKLYLPVIIDPEYHYEAVNREAQQNNTDSLLWWTKRLIALRKRFKALGRGSLEFLYPDNRKVLAFVRRYSEEIILVVANLSRMAQYTSLNLAEFKGKVPVEVFGRSEFPIIGENPYFLTLSPYAFYWFSLKPQRPEQLSLVAEPSRAQLPVLTVSGKWEQLFSQRIRSTLEAILSYYVRRRRWFGGKARRVQSSEIWDVIPLPHGDPTACLVLIRIEYTEGEPETYLVPLAFAPGERADQVLADFPQSVVTRLKLKGKNGSTDGVVYDAMYDKGFCTVLVDAVARHRRFRGERGEAVATPTKMFRQIRGPAGTSLEPAPLRAEQSNTSVVYGDRLLLKLFRRLGEGINPELEIGRFLTENVPFSHVAPVAGALEYRSRKNLDSVTLGILHGYVLNAGDAWKYTLDSLAYYFERVLSLPEGHTLPHVKSSLLALSQEDLPPIAAETVGTYLDSARLLGQQTAELHLALSLDWDDPAFAPEPFSTIYQRSVHHAMRSLTVRALELLRGHLEELPPPAKQGAQRVLGVEGEVMARFQAILKRKITAMRIRCHGDYHLGQVLYTGKDFVIIDFEGEPARPVSERRLKRSPLRDVAGMIRSFHYAAYAALFGQAPTVIRPEDLPLLEEWARYWYLWVSSTFLKAYLEVAEDSPLLPQGPEEFQVLLDAYLLEKAMYELSYELNNRPDWVRVPLEGILHLTEEQA